MLHFRGIKQKCQKIHLVFVLCPTMWTVCAPALKSIIENYEVLQKLWDEALDFVKETEMRNQQDSACMNSFEFVYGLLLGELLLNHSDNLSKTLIAGFSNVSSRWSENS